MKYYYPTSTLNFDAIYASMSIMPPAYYREEAIWFTRYEKTDIDLSDDVLVLYPMPVTWAINDSESDNYPMLVEIDAAPIDSLLCDDACAERLDISSEICCVATNRPIVLSAKDVLVGNIKIYFRNKVERDALLTRAKVGVSECKCAGMFNSLGIDITSAQFPKGVVSFDSIKERMLDATSNLKLRFEEKDFEAYEQFDREKGAETGFMAGKWIRSMRDGYCLDCVRGGFDYATWKAMLPKEFSSAIDMLCSKVGFRWDVNRKAIVDFCTELWNTCFKDDQTEARHSWHEMLRSIAKSHMDATFGYPVAGIKDRFMQALACFINGGRRHTIIVNSVVNDNVEIPELALALHGALVGYSALSRVIFQSPASKIIDPEHLKARTIRFFDGSEFKVRGMQADKKECLRTGLLQVFEQIGNDPRPDYFLQVLTTKDGWDANHKPWKLMRDKFVPNFKPSSKRPAKKNSVGSDVSYKERDLFSDMNPAASDSSSADEEVLKRFQLISDLLISDLNFPDVVTDFVHKEFSWPQWRQDKIMQDAKWLQNEYEPNGRYGRDPTNHHQDNTSTIGHFVNLINRNFREKGFPLSANERERLCQFLRNRYK